MTRVKLCGITSPEELKLAERFGADAIGFLVGQVHRAGDFVTEETARSLCLAASPFVSTVLVTHLELPDEIVALAQHVPCSVVQAHSDLSPATLALLRERLRPRRLIGKVSVEDGSALARAQALDGAVDGILLDSIDRASGRVGGTGRTHDWTISAAIVQVVRTPIVLAGGLTPENVGEAIRRVRPWSVDVNSGVEDGSGRKSAEKVSAFIAAARGC
jgi:phosphoribosylanthranilate isomerase